MPGGGATKWRTWSGGKDEVGQGGAAGSGGPSDPQPKSLEDRMTAEAGQIGAEETRRYDLGLGTLTEAFLNSQREMAAGLDAGLLFSKAADSIGARGSGGLEGIRSSLGSRGLNPNSGAAQGMMSRLLMSQQGSIVGATRDIGIYNKNQRVANAATNFANATTLAIGQQAPVSGIGYENLQNLFEGQIAREGIAAGVASQRAASQDNKMGTLGGGALGLVGRVVGK